jgi:hypothetical protein
MRYAAGIRHRYLIPAAFIKASGVITEVITAATQITSVICVAYNVSWQVPSGGVS